MKTPVSSAALSTLLVASVQATTLFSDNFNAPDNANFDASDLTGRRGGTLADTVSARSSRVQHGIVNNQLNILRHPTSGSGRIRFQEVAALPTNVWVNFAAGDTGATILAEGGLRVAFDWIPVDNTSANWIAFSAGIDGQGVAEPAIRVNAAGTDFGVLLRNNGLTQRFDNGAADPATPSFDVSVVQPRRVAIEMAFASFADGSSVVCDVLVDGVVVIDDYTVQWAGNGGALFMELANYVAGTRFDNLVVSGLLGLDQSLSATSFFSSVTTGGEIGTLAAAVNGQPEAATHELVSGTGDTDNAKFQITGDKLQSNGFDFQTLADGTELSVRVRGTGTVSGRTSEQVFKVRVLSDSDGDHLPDSWELQWAGNLTDLDGDATGPGPGAATGNFDGDTLTDLQEWQASLIHPALSPLLADTDGDELEDGSELAGAGNRPATNPTLADTDADGLNDKAETNTGTFVDGADTGSNPVDYDTDDDIFPDAYEVNRGGNPVNAAVVPPLPAPLTIAQVTTEADSGISPDKTYTHAVSGGYATTVNGVALSVLNAAGSVPNLTWSANVNESTVATFNTVATNTVNTWVPANGGISDAGLLDLFGGFAYSSNGDRPGAFQRYVLSGLTPGQAYALKLYARSWSNVASGRPIELAFFNGVDTVNALVIEDRPGTMLGNGNMDSAWVLTFPYVADGTEVTIQATVPALTLPVSGSFHLYGLTNEVATTAAPFVITNVAYTTTPTAKVTLTFSSEPGATYAVDSSTALTAEGQPGGWTELTGALVSQGAETTYEDTVVAGTAPTVFYRVRRVTP